MTESICIMTRCENPTWRGKTICEHHDRILTTGTPTERMFQILDYYRPNRQPDECWEWPRNTGSAYAHIIERHSGTRPKPHRITRLMCEHVHGPAPEDKPYALHTCDNPPCVNPSHLYWGDQSDNMQDMIRRGRAPWQNR